VHIATEGLSQFTATDIGYRMKRQTVEKLVDVKEILSYAVDDQGQQFVLLVEEECHGKVSNLFFRVLVRRDEIHGFEMSESDVPAEDVYVQKLWAELVT
jgi:hypothetical protein